MEDELWKLQESLPKIPSRWAVGRPEHFLIDFMQKIGQRVG